MDTFRKLEVKQLISVDLLYRELRDRFGDYFEGGMGAEALQTLVANFDLAAEAESLRETIRSGKGQKKIRALKRLKVVASFLATTNSPTGGAREKHRDCEHLHQRGRHAHQRLRCAAGRLARRVDWRPLAQPHP